MPLFDSVAASLGTDGEDQTFGYLQNKNIANILKHDGPHLEKIRENAIRNDVNLRKQAQNTSLKAGEYLLKSEINPGADSNQKVLKKMDLVAQL